jgi:galacturan 1,4-alpha-galacturonidase
VEGAEAGPEINQDSGNNGMRAFEGSSLLGVENVVFVNWTGWLHLEEGERETASISCSRVNPCYNIEVRNVSLVVAEDSTDTGVGKCRFTEQGGVRGLSGSGC